jgi:DNA-binding CsgD family transcriptional regulator
MGSSENGHSSQPSRSSRAKFDRIHPPILPEGKWAIFCRDSGLTPREGEVLFLLCRGYSYEEIISELGITRPTLRTHLRSAYGKAGCRSRVDLILSILHQQLASESRPSE